MLPVQGGTPKLVVGDAPRVARGLGGSPSGCGTTCGARGVATGCCRCCRAFTG